MQKWDNFFKLFKIFRVVVNDLDGSSKWNSSNIKYEPTIAPAFILACLLDNEYGKPSIELKV